MLELGENKLPDATRYVEANRGQEWMTGGLR